jgi:hypothetical protein
MQFAIWSTLRSVACQPDRFLGRDDSLGEACLPASRFFCGRDGLATNPGGCGQKGSTASRLFKKLPSGHCLIHDLLRLMVNSLLS